MFFLMINKKPKKNYGRSLQNFAKSVHLSNSLFKISKSLISLVTHLDNQSGA